LANSLGIFFGTFQFGFQPSLPNEFLWRLLDGEKSISSRMATRCILGSGSTYILVVTATYRDNEFSSLCLYFKLVDLAPD
jgi:hypothetical protein